MNLEELRKQIDEIDARMVALIAERQRVSAEIGKGKQETRRVIQDRERGEDGHTARNGKWERIGISLRED
jgi:chorismate mutase